jgi:flagellar basal body-associated protein FliL
MERWTMRGIFVAGCGLVILMWLAARAAENEAAPDETEPPAEATPQDALSEQRKADVEAFLARGDGFQAFQAAQVRLQKAIVLPEEEALADALVQHVSHEDPVVRSNVRYLLRRRAAKGIKGKYLEVVAPIVMHELEAGALPFTPTTRR